LSSTWWLEWAYFFSSSSGQCLSAPAAKTLMINSPAFAVELSVRLIFYLQRSVVPLPPEVAVRDLLLFVE